MDSVGAVQDRVDPVRSVWNTAKVAPLAVLCGILMMLALPPWGWWPLVFLGLAGLDQILARTTSARSRFRRTFAAGAGWLFPSTIWMADFTPPGYLLVGLIYSTMFALVGLITPGSNLRRPVLVGGFTLVELLRWSWPFGGVPISTLAMTQVGSPLLPIVRVGGPLLLSFTVLVVGVAISAAIDRQPRWAVGGLALAATLLILGLVGPRGEVIDTLEVAVVQGGGPQRTRATASQEPLVFQRHLDASADITTPVDLVLWPENVVNPKAPWQADDAPGLDKNFASQELSALATRLDAPILPGWFEKVSDTNTVNYTNVVLPNSEPGTFGDRYDKVRLVPFGEITPFRSVLESVAGDTLQARDVLPGTEPAVLDTPVGRLGISISWEIFFANRARDAIGNGGEVLLNPTNGSSYWLTVVQSQQVASSRLRAVETGRWVLQAAPTGFSAVISPDGTVVDRTGVSEAKVLQETIERRTGLTWANRVGNWPAILLAVVGLLAGAGFNARTGSRSADVGDSAPAIP